MREGLLHVSAGIQNEGGATYICYPYQQVYRMREGLHIPATCISRHTECCEG